MDTRFSTPANIIVCGPSQSGKSQLISQLISLKDKLFHPPVKKVYWIFSETHPNISGVIFCKKIPNNVPKNSLLVCDDLIFENDSKIAHLFVKEGHHRAITTIFVSQNLFHKGPNYRLISLNCHYLILMKNPRDRSQFMNLARQICPFNQNIFKEAYLDATKNPFGYLLLDFRAQTPDQFRMRTDIIHKHCQQTVYVPTHN